MQGTYRCDPISLSTSASSALPSSHALEPRQEYFKVMHVTGKLANVRLSSSVAHMQSETNLELARGFNLWGP